MAPYVKDEQIIVNVAKGIEEKTLMTMTDIISEEIPAAGVYVLSGPSMRRKWEEGFRRPV